MTRKPGPAQTALAVVVAGIGLATAARAGQLRVGADVGVATGFFGAPTHWLVDAAVTSMAVPGVELALGARFAWGGTLAAAAPAGFGRALLAVAFGSYRPALGLELEATLATERRPSEDDPPGSMVREYAERNKHNTIRAAVVLTPLRWLWKDWHLGLASFGIGTPLSGQMGDRMYLTYWMLCVGHPL
jgi:hypothetical protein